MYKIMDSDKKSVENSSPLYQTTHHPSCKTINWKWTTPDNKVHGANMGSPGDDSTQVGLMLAPWTLLSGTIQETSLAG